ncbi:MAG: 5-formyltetrahydrofolate cyclo-ligase [Caulobacteraceae bacterium]
MKDLIRKQMLERRSGMNTGDVEKLSGSIMERLLESGLLSCLSDIMVYLDFKKEVKTDSIISYCLENGKNIYVPVCIPETHELVASRIVSLDDLHSGFYGIREPGLHSIRLSDSRLLDLILVPGVAFDKSGNRLGFGAGYYDRFMSRLGSGVKKVALAYSFQLVDQVPSGEYDVPLDFIVTEKEIINCTGKNVQ